VGQRRGKVALSRAQTFATTAASQSTTASRTVAHATVYASRGARSPALHARPVLDLRRELRRHAAAVARLARELAVVGRQLAAQDDRRRPAVHLPAVPRAVVRAVQLG